jgi:hypothetical protein
MSTGAMGREAVDDLVRGSFGNRFDVDAGRRPRPSNAGFRLASIAPKL